MRSVLARVLARLGIDPNCTWCGGTGIWNGKPCIQCSPVTVDPADDY